MSQNNITAAEVISAVSNQNKQIAAGNIGCLTQIAGGAHVPVVHTVELLDWASGGPEPAALRRN